MFVGATFDVEQTSISSEIQTETERSDGCWGATSPSLVPTSYIYIYQNSYLMKKRERACLGDSIGIFSFDTNRLIAPEKFAFP